MGFRTSHGNGVTNGSGAIRYEQPADEVPAGVAAPVRIGFAKDMSRDAQRERAKKGGRNKAAWRKALQHFGYTHVQADPEFAEYLKEAKEFAHAEMGRLAKKVGGGECSVGPGGMVMLASLAMAVAMHEMNSYLSDQDPAHLSRYAKLNDIYRLNIQTAQALTAAEAKSRLMPSQPMMDLAKALNTGGYRAPDGATVETMTDSPLLPKGEP